MRKLALSCALAFWALYTIYSDDNTYPLSGPDIQHDTFTPVVIPAVKDTIKHSKPKTGDYQGNWVDLQ